MATEHAPTGDTRWWDGRLSYLPHTYLTAFIATIVAMLALVIVSILAPSLPESWGEYRQTALGAVVVLLGLLVTALLMRRVRRADLGLETSGVARAIGVGVALAIVFNVIAEIAAHFDSRLSQSSSNVLGDFGFGESMQKDFVLASSLVIFAPLWEEIFFRGLVFRAVRDSLHRRFKNALPAIVAIAFSGFIFMSAHGDEDQQAQAPYLFLLGVLLALSYLLTGNLLAPITLHTVNNAYAIGDTVRDSQFTLANDMTPWIFFVLVPITLALYWAIAQLYGRRDATLDGGG